MFSLNEVNLLGNVTNQPELNQTQKGTVMTKFGLATNEGRKKDDGEWETTTEFHNCVAFGKTAEIIESKIKKGEKVFIKGKIQSSNYTDKDGNKKRNYSIIVNQVFIFTPSPKKGLFEAAEEIF